ncbi:MAG: 1-deoxy-D-xylulose-5-phosphate reductoisomerase [Clostridia bacterium]|nr:1-deoxy-D-xylulose-5-phosphate reductoisomerase [Clostridia bacterium]
MKKRVTILGSTGSIGRQTLEVIALLSDEYEIYGLSASSNVELLAEQAKRFSAKRIASVKPMEGLNNIDVLTGEDSASELARDANADIVVLAISGIAALKPLLNAIQNGKRIAIANKESLVCGGDLVDEALVKYGAELVPIDSEQSAIFQCLKNGKREEVKRLILTASGGPFFKLKLEELSGVSMEQVLAHPTWNMGRKITLDSATMFNKGLEIIEAARLFKFGADKIDVLIHPQSIVHSMVEYCDGTVIANMSLPDMRLPIQYALSYPKRTASLARPLKLEEVGNLSFFKADMERFSALKLAYAALNAGGGYPVVYNGANERAAELYFGGIIDFLDIENAVAYAFDRYENSKMRSINDILDADFEAHRLVDEFAAQKGKK